MSATAKPPRALDDPEVGAALDRVSAVIQRALERVMAHEERALLRSCAAESPPAGQKEGAAPSKATPSDVQHPSHEVSACLPPF
jgi:hypothetical protein